ncbi:hypothetical protein OIU78_023573 [Salix suchowensis]|nr:hypothetical protein OIU78_023573 [Salix suchowensis]
MIPGARPPPCVQFHDSCESASTSQLLLLYSSLGLMAIGAGGIRSSSLAFGADQLGKRDKLQRAGILESFFSWYYATVSVAVFLAITCILYIQDNMGWKVGFGIPVVLMILSTLSFFLASPIFVKSKAKAGWLDGFARVLAASFRKRSIKLSSQVTDDVYHHRKGSKLVVPTEKLRFLNKACVIRNPEEDLISDGRASNPWSLCTVDEVEELKSLIKASTMDRHITSKFQVPAASFTAFQLFSSVIWIALYDRVAIPLASKNQGANQLVSA